MAYNVRSLIDLTEEEVALLPLKHEIVFDNGEVRQCYLNETRYSHLFWALFKPYPNVAICPQHHVGHYLTKSDLGTDTHLRLCEAIFRSVVHEAGLFYPEQKEPILKHIYERISHAMNQLSIWTEEDVISIDILDFVNIANDPKILTLKEEAVADTEKIGFAYEESIKHIKSDPRYFNNGLAKAIRSKMVKNNQVTQCVVMRGIGTEVDGSIYQKPISSSYTTGNRTIYNFVADSRTGAKSHFYSDTALQDSEYMGRKFQLFAQVLERIEYTDCGSERYIDWYIEPPRYDDSGVKTYPGDLEFMAGKYYLDPETKKLTVIRGDETHLVGKQVLLRTAIFCNTPDPHAVCHVCAGQLTENMSRFSNPGHLGCINITRETTQNILSIKHVNMSASAVKVLLGDHERLYMNPGILGTAFYFNDYIKRMKPEIVVAREEAAGLIDLANIHNIDQISPQFISEVKTIKLRYVQDTQANEVTLDVTQKSKPSMMSKDFLQYIKNHKWKVDENNNFVIDIGRWNFDLPVFVLQNKEESYVDLAKQIGNMVESSQKMMKKRTEYNAAASLLRDLFAVTNSKLRVNILAFEFTVYGLMVASKSSFALSRGAKEPVLGVSENLTRYRSLGPALAFEGMEKTLTNPVSFFKGVRPDSPMDVFMCPQDVVDHYFPNNQ